MTTPDIRLSADALTRVLGRSGVGAGEVLELLRSAVRLRRTADALDLDTDDALGALEQVAAETPTGAGDPASTLTADQERVLRAAGSLRAPLPPLAHRGSLATATAEATLLADALTVREAAAELGVSDSRVRQRLAARTLLGVQTGAGWRLPRAVVTASAGANGLDRVLPAFPPDAHPVAVLALLEHPHVDLRLADQPVSPLTWLEGGGDADTVAGLVRDAYRLA